MRVNGSGGPFRPKQAETETAKPASSKEAPQATVARGPETRQSSTVAGDGFESVSRSGGTGKATGSAAARTPPAEVRTPSADYFRQRHDDYVRRNPGAPVPELYLGQGQKSLEKLSSLGAKELQPAGLAWRDRAVKALQDAVELKRASDPAAFAQLERDPEAFKKFSADALAKACVNSGLLNLPAQDQVKVATTPELRELLGKDGVKQVADTIGRLKPEDVARGGKAVEELGQAVAEFRKSLKLPRLELPRLPVPSLRLS
ncbi:hypothetical protein [Hyalangium versicolor]|uniref:hypothetical protein n=1 Tax=Hyalangium versicolor TaxID=2861190 RepID=UPI001CCFF179|nr:hypothetical protein [Hyalangium versicolor]